MTSYSHRLYLKALRLARANTCNGETWSLLERARKLGDGNATYALATWYLFGKYVKKDPVAAVSLLKEATLLGNPSAMFDLAVCAEKGVGMQKDLGRAVELYMMAGLRGDASAKEAAGRCYWHGIGIGKDRHIAAIWLDSAKISKNATRKR